MSTKKRPAANDNDTTWVLDEVRLDLLVRDPRGRVRDGLRLEVEMDPVTRFIRRTRLLLATIVFDDGPAHRSVAWPPPLRA